MKRFLGFLFVALVIGAQGAFALPPQDPFPVTPGAPSGGGQVTVEEELVDAGVVTDIGGPAGSDILDQVLQSTVFSCPVSTCDGILIIEQAGLANQNRMGIYDLSNPANRVDLFVGADTAGDLVNFEFDVDGSVIVNGTDSNIIFGSANDFGLFIQNNTNTFFTNDALNSDLRRHVLIFYSELGGVTGSGQPVFEDSFLFAFEDLPEGAANADFDYNDFIYNFKIQQTPPPGIVPEPASMLLFGLGGIGALGFGRGRKFRA